MLLVSMGLMFFSHPDEVKYSPQEVDLETAVLRGGGFIRIPKNEDESILYVWADGDHVTLLKAYLRAEKIMKGPIWFEDYEDEDRIYVDSVGEERRYKLIVIHRYPDKEESK
jgi:hypothetical protein